MLDSELKESQDRTTELLEASPIPSSSGNTMLVGLDFGAVTAVVALVPSALAFQQLGQCVGIQRPAAASVGKVQEYQALSFQGA